MPEALSTVPEKIAQAKILTDAHRRLWLYTIVHGGLHGAAEQLGMSTTTLHNYLHGRHMPRAGAMVALQQRSEGRIPMQAWADPPQGQWPPLDPARAYARLSKKSRKPLAGAEEPQ